MAAIGTLLIPKRQRERGGEWFMMHASIATAIAAAIAT
jgi:hypothetical protein